MSLLLGNTHFGVEEHHACNLQVNISEENWRKRGKDKANWPGDLGNMGERYLRILCTILTFLKVEIMSK